MMISQSGKKELDFTDVKKLLRNAIIYGGGESIAYILHNLNLVDLGEYTPMFGLVAGAIVDALYRWYKTNTKLEDIGKVEVQNVEQK